MKSIFQGLRSLAAGVALAYATATTAWAYTATIQNPTPNGAHAVGGIYTFTGTMTPNSNVLLAKWTAPGGVLASQFGPNVTYTAGTPGVVPVTFEVWWDTDSDGLADAYSSHQVMIRQFIVTFQNDDNNLRERKEPEEEGPGLLAPMIDPVNVRFEITGAPFTPPITVVFASYSLNGGQGGTIIHAGSQLVSRDGTAVRPIIIDGGSGEGDGSGRVTGWHLSQQLRDVELDIRIGGTNSNEGIGASVKLTVAEVESTEWEEMIAGQLTDNPTSKPGGGKRLFPDKRTPNDNEIRDQVYVTTRISPEVPTLLVYHRAYDMDDPSQNGSGNAADTKDTDTEWFGDDNFGDKESWEIPFGRPPDDVYPMIIATDGDGVARLTLNTSLCAGNNHKVAGALNRAYLDDRVQVDVGQVGQGLLLIDSDGNYLGNLKGGATELLTIWRRLYMELDCLTGRPAPDISGTVVSVADAPSGGKDLTFTFLTGQGPFGDASDDLDSATMGNGRFEGGYVTLSGVNYAISANGQSFLRLASCTLSGTIAKDGLTTLSVSIVAFGSDASTSTVTLSAPVSGDYAGGVLTLGSEPFAIQSIVNSVVTTSDVVTVAADVYDDDGPNPQLPSTVFLQSSDDPDLNILSDAYIVPEYNGDGNWLLGYRDADLAFVANVVFESYVMEAQMEAGQGTRGLRGKKLWIGYLQAAHQGGERNDHDPASEGFSDGWGGFSSISGIAGSLLYEESSREWAIAHGNVALLERVRGRIAAHELVHTFGIFGHFAGGIMDGSLYLANLSGTVPLDPESIRQIRWDEYGPH